MVMLQYDSFIPQSGHITFLYILSALHQLWSRSSSWVRTWCYPHVCGWHCEFVKPCQKHCCMADIFPPTGNARWDSWWCHKVSTSVRKLWFHIILWPFPPPSSGYLRLSGMCQPPWRMSLSRYLRKPQTGCRQPSHQLQGNQQEISDSHPPTSDLPWNGWGSTLNKRIYDK